MQNDKLMSHSVVNKFGVRSPCAAGNELKIKISGVSCDLIHVVYVIFFYEYHYGPHKLAFQNIMQAGD